LDNILDTFSLTSLKLSIKRDTHKKVRPEYRIMRRYRMMRLLAYYLTVVIALLSLGCASVSVNSMRDSSFSEPIQKLFVVVNHNQVDMIDRSFTPYLITALKDEFSKKGVETEIVVISPLDLNANTYASEIASYKPDGVMTILANGGIIGPYGGMQTIVYDISIFESAKNIRIWRARIEASGGTGVREKRMRMMAQKLIQRLSDDKIITSEPRKKGVLM